jgi:hypothetical protein
MDDDVVREVERFLYHEARLLESGGCTNGWRC